MREFAIVMNGTDILCRNMRDESEALNALEIALFNEELPLEDSDHVYEVVEL